MGKITAKVAKDTLRADYVQALMQMLEDAGEEVLQVKSNEISIPVVGKDGEDYYVNFTVKVPNGSRDGYAYDAYEEAEDFQMKQKAKAEKKKEQEAKKAAALAKRKEREAKRKEGKSSKQAVGFIMKLGFKDKYIKQEQVEEILNDILPYFVTEPVMAHISQRIEEECDYTLVFQRFKKKKKI